MGRRGDNPCDDGLRISEVSGLRVDDVDLVRGLIHVLRQTYPGRGGLVTKKTKGAGGGRSPIIDPLRPTLVRLIAGLTWMADAGIDLHILQFAGVR